MKKGCYVLGQRNRVSQEMARVAGLKEGAVRCEIGQKG